MAADGIDKRPTMDETTLKKVIEGLLSRKSGVQEQTALEYLHPDVFLYHWVARCTNREDYLKCLRLYTLFNFVKPVYREFVIDGEKAMVWLDQHVTCTVYPGSWFKPAIVPTIMVFKFVELPGGRVVIKEHIDHCSLYAFIWSFGGPGVWMFEKVLQPLGNWTAGKVLGIYDYFTLPTRKHLSWLWGVPAGSAPRASARHEVTPSAPPKYKR